jgi:hypothetical protein
MDTTHETGGAARRRVLPLAIANAALLATLAFIEFGPVAVAQPAGNDPAAARPRGQYTLVGGRVQTGNANAVYIVDSANQEMVVLQWEDGRNILQGVGYRDLEDDQQRRGQR